MNSTTTASADHYDASSASADDDDDATSPASDREHAAVQTMGSVLPLFEVDPTTVRPLERERASDPHCERDDHCEADTGVEEYDSVSKTVTAPSTGKKRRKRKHRHGRNNKSKSCNDKSDLPSQHKRTATKLPTECDKRWGRQSQDERAATIRPKEGEGGSEGIDDAMTIRKKLVV